MFWLKACPKCRGDLYKRGDIYGEYIACMHCGRYLTAEEQASLEGVAQPRANRPTKPAADRQRVAA